MTERGDRLCFLSRLVLSDKLPKGRDSAGPGLVQVLGFFLSFLFLHGKPSMNSHCSERDAQKGNERGWEGGQLSSETPLTNALA